MSRVTLEPARREDAPLLSQLLQLYIHDLSEVFAIDIGADGRFDYPYLSRYWEEPAERFPFLVRDGGALAGFVLVTRGSPAVPDPSVFDVAEFFVLRRLRRAGVGSAAALRLFGQMRGPWIVRVSEGNPAALAFWQRVVAAHTGSAWAETTRPGSPHPWRVLSFHTPALPP